MRIRLPELSFIMWVALSIHLREVARTVNNILHMNSQAICRRLEVALTAPQACQLALTDSRKLPQAYH